MIDWLLYLAVNIKQNLWLESSLVTLVNNQLLLSKYGFEENPKSLDDIEQICKNILLHEKSMDNFKITCITGAFGDIDQFMANIVTWIASAGGSIIENKNVTISSEENASILDRINAWIDDGYIRIDDFEKTSMESAMNDFNQGDSVFIFMQLTQINNLIQNPPYFEWGVTPFPGVNSNFVGSMSGWSLGVYKYSRNPDAAVKAIKWITAEETQKNSILLSHPVVLLPTRKKFYDDSEICASIGHNLCSSFKYLNPILPPWKMAKKNYYNMTLIITETFKKIVLRELDVGVALENLHFFLKTTFKLEGTYTQIDAPIRPIKKGYAHLTLQVWILSVFCTIFTLMAVAYRLRHTYLIRKLNQETAHTPKEEKQSSFIEMKSLKVGEYNFQPLVEDDSN